MSSINEQKLKKKHFHIDEIQILISIWKDENISKMFSKSRRHNEIYQLIAEKMNEFRFVRSREEVKNKIANLKQEFGKRKPKSGQAVPDWIFYDDLNIILGAKDKYNMDLGDDSIPSSSFDISIDDNMNDSTESNVVEYLTIEPLDIDAEIRDDLSKRQKKKSKRVIDQTLEELVEMGRENNNILQKMLQLEEDRDERQKYQEDIDNKLSNALIKFLEHQSK